MHAFSLQGVETDADKLTWMQTYSIAASKKVCVFDAGNRIGFDANPLVQPRSDIHRMLTDVDQQQLLRGNRRCLAGRVSHGQTQLATEQGGTDVLVTCIYSGNNKIVPCS